MSNRQIISLNPRHYKILELCLRGFTNKQIADYLGMSAMQISNVINSPSFQHELAIRRSQLETMSNESIVDSLDDVTRFIRDGARQAVQRLVNCVDSPDESIALRASQDVLDRAGYPRVSRVESRSMSVNLSSADAELIRDTLNIVGGQECQMEKKEA